MRQHPRRSKRAHHQRRRNPPGSAPGTLTVDPEAQRPRIRALAFGPDAVSEHAIELPEKVEELLGTWPVVWVDVSGLGDTKVIESLANVFGLHRLAIEDVLNTHQRPKVEQYGDQLFIVLRSMSWSDHLESEQISLFVGEGFVLTFHERQEDCFDTVRERIRRGRGRIRSSSAGYLAYAVIDAIVDHYFPILEQYGETIEVLEDEVLESTTRATITKIHDVKRDLLTLRRAIWPQRDALNALLRESDSMFGDETRIYLRDCYDHTVQLMDMTETYRELASGLLDVYLTSASNHMNEIMKVLTIIATIFIPLSFVAGVYGMNFDVEHSPYNMPELGWKYGYLFCLGLMGLMAASLLLFFRRKGWLGASRRS